MDNDVKLVLETDNTLIEFKVIDYKTKLAYCDTQNKVDYLTKTNEVECYYYFSSEGIGWGSVSDVYITTKDLELLSKGLSQILIDKTKKLHFETEKRLLQPVKNTIFALKSLMDLRTFGWKQLLII